MGFRVWGLGFRVWGLGLRVWGLGFRVSSVLGVYLGIQGLYGLLEVFRVLLSDVLGVGLRVTLEGAAIRCDDSPKPQTLSPKP